MLVLAAGTGRAAAEIVTRSVDYQDGDVALQGFLAYDDAQAGKRPGVLIVHEWWGLNDYARQRAREVAAMGYVAFALDMYGRGVLATEREKAAELSGQFYGKPLMRTRAQAGLAVLAAQPQVDPQRIAAIGFCFGGTTVLNLAYANADVRAVVSFHGGMTPPTAEDSAPIRPRILVLHGADDPLVNDEAVKAFIEAMRAKKADWQLVHYGGAVHSFSNPGADAVGIAGVAYHAPTADRSWRLMKSFFDEVFDERGPLPGSPGR